MTTLYFFRAINGAGDQIDSIGLQCEAESFPPTDECAADMMQANPGFLWADEVQPIRVIRDGPFDLQDY